jgi:ribosomal protein L40E
VEEAPDARKRKNLDVECLKCGAFNIPENRVCGRCGASLPVVFDEEGKILNWALNPRRDRILQLKAVRKRHSSNTLRWMTRLGFLLTAFFAALWFLQHRK